MVQLISSFPWIAGRLIITALLFCAINLQAQQKNVLFIAVDDLKPAIGAFGDEMALTPNMDRLAAEGSTFLKAYCQQAVCAPSRASILTGLRPDKTQVWDLKTLIRDKRPDVTTLPQLFKENGYQTHAIGKIFDPRSVDKGHDKVSWTIPYVEPSQLPGKGPQPRMGAYQSVENIAQISFFESLARANGLTGNKKNSFIRENFKPSTEKADVADDAYTDGRIAASALQKLDEFSSGKAPFMLMVGFKKPHLPFVAPAKYWDLYERKDFELAEWPKKSKKGPAIAYHGIGELGSYTDIPPTLDDFDRVSIDKQKELIHGYYASVSFIDAQIGKILKKLEDTGLRENTIIVLWGDHGFHLGDHNLWCKHTNFEQATRAPLIVIDPGKAPRVVQAPAELLDIFPTICELAGVNPGEEIQGNSLVPLMSGEQANTFAISQWPSRRNGGMGYSLRTGRYRYTEWYETYKSNQPRSDKQLLAVELYDYEVDPNETKNLSGDKNYTSIVAELQITLHTFLSSQLETDDKNVAEPAGPKGPTFKSLVQKIFSEGSFYIGATIGADDINTPQSELLVRQFNYTTPENAAKQARVHPKPGVWSWDAVDSYVKFAANNDLAVRLHGPVSPQASKWAKADNRTPEELLTNMSEYMLKQCQRFNGNKSVKWLDVVNETVSRNGEWFGPLPGVDKWENPWLTIGKNDDGSDVPLYITKAFEIATENAPDIKLVYNQHGGMEPAMWEKVKSTILYLRKQGYRVDGLGWQAHLKNTDDLALNAKDLQFFEELIDWAHANKLEFHVTEIDYKIAGDCDAIAENRQAAAFANILKVLLSKRASGVVTYNTWGLKDGEGRYADRHRFMFDENLNAKPAYYAIQKVLANPDDLTVDLGIAASLTAKNLLQSGSFEQGKAGWNTFGQAAVVSDGNQVSGESCAKISFERSGISQTVKKLKPNTDYQLSAWIKTSTGKAVVLKVVVEGQEDLKVSVNSPTYKQVFIKFNTGKSTEAKITCLRWGKGTEKMEAWADDLILQEL